MEPHRKEVHDGEVAKGNEEIAGSDECRDSLFEQKRGENRFDSDFQFNDDEKQEEQDGNTEGRGNSHVIPLFSG